MKKGKFIVIDGTDGSGKKTQTTLLAKRLKKEGFNVKLIDFPQYENNFFGEMVGRYLSGEFGSAEQVSPYLASILYAADRFETKVKIEKWLAAGNIVISDRYASSNQIHQGGKISDMKKRKEFLIWLEKMEFSVFKIPRPNASIYLDVPLECTLEMLKNKSAQDRKKYLHGKVDIHESDQKHLFDAKKSAIALIKKNNNWISISCAKKCNMFPIETIHEMIWGKVKEILKK